MNFNNRFKPQLKCNQIAWIPKLLSTYLFNVYPSLSHAVTTITFLLSTLKLLPVENKLTPAEKDFKSNISLLLMTKSIFF